MITTCPRCGVAFNVQGRTGLLVRCPACGTSGPVAPRPAQVSMAARILCVIFAVALWAVMFWEASHFQGGGLAIMSMIFMGTGSLTCLMVAGGVIPVRRS